MLAHRFPVPRRGTWVVVAVLGLAAVLIWTAASRAASCDVSWNTAASGSWNTASNWSTGSVPTSSQNVCLPAGSYTVTLTGSGVANSVSVGSGVTLAVAISSNNSAQLTLSANGASSNAGTIDLTDSDSSAGSGSPFAKILLDAGATLTNTGTIISDAGGNSFGAREIDMQSASNSLINDGTMTVAQDLQIDSGTQDGTFTTSGNITINSGKKLLVDPNGGGIGGSPATNSAGLDIEGGTITDNGTFALGIDPTGSDHGAAGLIVNGGTIDGTSASTGLIVVAGSDVGTTANSTGASFNGAGSGTYTFVGSAAATTLGGTIGSSQTVVLSASSAGGGVGIDINSSMTNNGTIELTDSDTSGTNQNADRILIGTGATLTNASKIVSDQTVAGQQLIDGQSPTSTLDNTGEIDVNGRLQLDTGQNGTFTTAGTVKVAAGATLELDPNGGNTMFNLNGGTVTNNGTMELGINSGGGSASGTSFNVNGATVSGNPMIAAAATTTFSGAGSGSFQLEGGGSTLAGTIPAADTVALSGTTGSAGSVNVTTSGNVVNDGTLTMTDPDSTPSTSAFAGLVIPSSSTFTNNGTMVSDPGPAASGYRSIDGIVTNAGTVRVNMLLQFALHSASALDNSGTVNIAAGQGLMIFGSSGTYSQSTGTTTVSGGATLDATSIFLSGGTLTGAGTICGPGGTQSAPCGSGSSATDLTNGATVAPGPTPSTLTIEGNYTQSSTGTLAVGVGPGGNDELALIGSGSTAALDGTLAVSTAPGFTPATGSAFKILNAPGGVSGTFATTTGLSSGPYQVVYNPTDVTLNAVAPAVAIGFNPSPMTFGSPSNTIAVGTSPSQSLTVTDTGTAPLILGTLSLAQSSGVFSLSSDTCSGQTIQPGNSCTVKLTYAPTAVGTDSATLSVPDNAPGSPQNVALIGHAGAAGSRVTLSTSSIDYGPVGVGVPSVRAVRVTNGGSAPLSISSVKLAGADATDFRISADACAGQTIAAGSACAVEITLTASATGTRSGTLTLADSAPDSPQTVPLTATASSSGTLTGTVADGAVAGSPPLRNASVDLCTYTATSTGSCRSTTTNTRGTYSFTGLEPGSYRMEVHPPNPTLQPTSAVIQISAGPDSEDFTLTRPQTIPAGVSFNGQTSGQAVSFWESPDTVRVPLDAPSKGSAGLYGVTVIDFGVEPAGSSGAQPDAHGRLEVEYRFDSGGIPRLVAIDTTAENHPASIGSWTTSLATTPSVGEDVRGLTAQGVFTPPRLQIGGTVTTVVTTNGTTKTTSAPVHGEFDYTIGHWSEFGALAGAAKDNAPPTAHAAAGGGTAGGGLGGAAAGDLTNEIANPTSDPSTQPCPSLPTYSVQNDQPTLTLPNGDQWSYDSTTEVLSGDVHYSDPTEVFTTPDGVKVFIQNATLVDGAIFPGTIRVQANVNGETLQWTVWEGDNPLSAAGITSGLRSNPDAQLPASYWPDADGFILALNIYVNPSGTYIADMRNAYNAQGNFDPRYTLYDDGSVHDLQTGSVWNSFGQLATPGSFRGQPCGQSGPPQPSEPPAPPSSTPTPNDPNASWAWIASLFGYQDPSGMVVTTSKIPVAGAKVVLERAPSPAGFFRPVPNRSIVMSPSNRRNPDQTTALGAFGWDVLGGFYKVTAQHPGCTAASDGSRTRLAHTPVLVVPPPVTGLRLVLRCAHLTRTNTHTTLEAKKVPVSEVVLVATVRGRHPAGLVEFTSHGHAVGYVGLDPHTHRATLTVTGHSAQGFRAIYEGDGYNAPSSGSG